MNIFKLFGDIAIKGAKEADRQVKELGKTARKTTKSVGELGKKAAVAGKQFSDNYRNSILGAGAATLAFVKIQGGAIDQMAKTARGAGLAVEEFQQLTFALGQFAGVTDQQVAPALRRVNTIVGQGVEGNKAAVQQLSKLGFSLRDISSGSITSSQALDAVFQRINSARSDAEASAIAAKFFGEEMSKLGPILRGNKDAFDKLKEGFTDVLTSDDAAQVEAFNDKLDVLERRLGLVSQKMLVELLPVFEGLIEFMKDTGVPAIKAVAGVLTGLFKAFDALPTPVKQVLGVLAGLVLVLGPAIALITKLGGLIAAAAGAFVFLVTKINPVIAIITTLAGLLTWVIGLFGDMSKAAGDAADSANKAAESVVMSDSNQQIQRSQQGQPAARPAAAAAAAAGPSIVNNDLRGANFNGFSGAEEQLTRHGVRLVGG